MTSLFSFPFFLLSFLLPMSIVHMPLRRRPRVGPYGERIHKGRRKRFTRHQRADRIYRRIYDSTLRNKPLTISKVATLERISKNTVYRYLRIIRRSQRKRGILIKVRRFGKKRFLVYENVAVKEARFVSQQRGAWELRASTKYSQGSQRGLQIELSILIPSRDNATIHRGMKQIAEILKDHNFTGLIDSMEFGTVPATSLSRPFFKYKHYGEDWTTVW